MKIILSILFIFIGAILNRLGGSGADKTELGIHGNKGYRLFGIPIALFVFSALIDLSWFGLIKAVSSSAAMFGTLWLPITLIGGDLKKNYWWLPIKGALHGISFVIISLWNWPIGLVFLALFSALYAFFMIMADIFQPYTKRDLWAIQERLNGGLIFLAASIVS